MAFRKMRGIRLSYVAQGRIYFTCLYFHHLLPDEQEKIRRICNIAGGEYSAALFTMLTGEKSVHRICADSYVSPSTIYRVRKKFYELYAKNIDSSV